MTRALAGEGSSRDADYVVLARALLATDSLESCCDEAFLWLRDRAGIERGLCCLVGPGGRLEGRRGLGFEPATVESFELDLASRQHPLVITLSGTEPVVFNQPEERWAAPGTPFGNEPFLTITLPTPESEGSDGIGLLLLGPATKELETSPELLWAVDLLATRILALGHAEERARRRRLTAERDRFRAVLEAMIDPILVTDRDGRTVIVNSEADHLLTATDGMSEGRRRAVAINNMLFSASQVTDPAVATRTPTEVPLVDPIDGRDLLFELISSPIDISGEPGVVSILRDVTDLQRALEEIESLHQRLPAAEARTRRERERLDLILSAVADPILVTDYVGNMMLTNPPAEKLFTTEDSSAPQVQRRVRSNDAVFTSAVTNLHTTTATSWRGELELLDPESGRKVPVEAIAGKVHGHGEDEAVVTILHDLTEAKEKAHLYTQLERQSEQLQVKVREATAELAEQNELLRRQALELEQASAMKSQFLANVSHELRTPLNAMIGYIALLEDGIAGELTDPQKEKVARLESNTRHLLAIINDLLDIARIESGKLSVELHRFTIGELVSEVRREVTPLIEASPVPVSWNLPEDTTWIESDWQKLKQILINLLSNALKFTRRGSIRVRAGCEDDHFVLAVEDTGIGIGEEQQKRIFEPFGRSAYDRRHEGTGLGLSICRRLAAALDGTIELESTLGAGSTFTLRVPRHRNAEVAAS